MRWLTAAVAMLVVAGGAAAQPATPSVLLRIRPSPGDTLDMRLEQQIVMTGKTRMGQKDSTRSVTSNTRMRARVIIERAEPAWTMVLAVTDSVEISVRGGRQVYGGDALRKALEGKRLRMRVSPQGITEVTENPDSIPSELSALLANLPASLPKEPVSVGDSWMQDVALPPAAGVAAKDGGALRTTFRLDSLSREGRIAYISVSGKFERDTLARGALPDGASLRSSGLLKGAMRIDRVRGWLIDSRATITINSLLTPPPGSQDQPMTFHMKITQHIRAIDKR